jgi:uncharacterized protein (DUF697 family)
MPSRMSRQADRQEQEFMARVGSPKGFLDIVKSVSINDIAKEANRPVSVAIVGDEARRLTAMEALFSGDPTGKELPKTRALPESPFVQAFDTMTDEAGFPRTPGVFDLVIDVGGGRRDMPVGTPVYSVAELGGWTDTLERILDDKPDLALPLARSFPVFRRSVTQRIIAQTSTANAQFSLLTGVTAQFPLLAIALPVNSLSDVVILTKNQAMMVLRIAAAHGLSLDYRSRLKELVPLVGNALGWRTVARQFAGLIPVFGILARGMIAYAGTVTIGRAAQLYYETGEHVTAAQVRRIYAEAYEASRERVKAIAASLRSGKGGDGGGGGPRLALPVAPQPVEQELLAPIIDVPAEEPLPAAKPEEKGETA